MRKIAILFLTIFLVTVMFVGCKDQEPIHTHTFQKNGHQMKLTTGKLLLVNIQTKQLVKLNIFLVKLQLNLMEQKQENVLYVNTKSL